MAADDRPAASAAWDDGITIFEHAARGELEAARRQLADTPDLLATATALTRLLVLFLPSIPADEMTRFVRTARNFDPLEP
jgi:hypothetical protein